MLQGITQEGEMKNVKVSEEGKLLVESSGEQNSKIVNTNEEAIPVEVINEIQNPVHVELQNSENTLLCDIVTLGSEEEILEVNKKVTSISIANYSESSVVKISIDTISYKIGPNLAIEIPINKEITSIILSSENPDTKIQYIVKTIEDTGSKAGFDTSLITNCTNMFWASEFTTAPFFDTSNVISMENMFLECSNLKTIPKYNTNKVEFMNCMFSDCPSLQEIPELDTSNVDTMTEMFYGCSNLQTIPKLNTSSINKNRFEIGSMDNMFVGCDSLTEDSLNNILAMCINAIQMDSKNKTLRFIGLSQEQAEICETLSNYQAFLDAGWTTGYEEV